MQLHTIDLSEFDPAETGEVSIRCRQSFAARQIVDGAGIAGRREGEGDDVEAIVGLNLQRKMLAVLETSVVSWSGVRDMETGAELPASRRGYLSDGFDPDLGDWLVERIVEHYESHKRTPAERGNSPAASKERSTVAAIPSS